MGFQGTWRVLAQDLIVRKCQSLLLDLTLWNIEVLLFYFPLASMAVYSMGLLIMWLISSVDFKSLL